VRVLGSRFDRAELTPQLLALSNVSLILNDMPRIRTAGGE